MLAVGEEKYRTKYFLTMQMIFQNKAPYFWRSGNTAELDFIYEDEGNIIPVEVKAAANTQAKSYCKQFCKKHQNKSGFKFSLKNSAENDCKGTRVFSLPLYLLMEY